MKTFRRSLAVVVLLASVAGFQSAATAMSRTSASPSTRSVTGCCYVFVAGHWMCVPC